MSASLESEPLVRTLEGRRRLERWWFGLVMAWSAIRVAAVWRWLDIYGVNPLVYALVDVGSSAPYALGSARTIGALIDRKYGRAAMWSLLAAVCFAAPDVYIVAAGHDMPWGVYGVVGAIALLAAMWAVWTGRRDVSGGRVSTSTSETLN